MTGILEGEPSDTLSAFQTYAGQSQETEGLIMIRFRKTTVLLLAASMMVLAAGTQAEQQPKEFRKWPAGTSPKEIGKRVAERLVSTPHSNFSRPGPPPFVTYPEVVTWYGA